MTIKTTPTPSSIIYAKTATLEHAREGTSTTEKAKAEVQQMPMSLTPARTSAMGSKTSRNSLEDVIHKNFVEYGRNAKEWLRKCALLLPEINRKEIWKKKGFENIFEYARILAGMGRFAVEDALRILKKIEDKPELLKVVEQKGLNVVRPVATIATKRTAKFWAKNATVMSKHTLEAYVREYKKDEQKSRTGTDNRLEKAILMELSSETAAKLEKLKGQGSWEDLMKELLAAREEKLESKKPQPVETSSRHIPTKVKKFVLNKTRGQCAYPGCTKPHQILHHTHRFALDHTHDPDQIVPLCNAHEHLAHHGLIAHEDDEPETWEILKEPVWWDFKQVIDEKVQAHRAKT